MNKPKYIIPAGIVIVFIVVGCILLRLNLVSLPLFLNPAYNPNYADAIQKNKPELCQNINYALVSGPDDGIYKLYDQEAIEKCIEQVQNSGFGCECDSEEVLNNMRKRFKI